MLGRETNSVHTLSRSDKTGTRSLLDQPSGANTLAALQKAIDEGDASGIAEEGVFARIRTSLDLPVRTR